jgi:hypothetical protein
VDAKIDVADTTRVLAVKAREAAPLGWQPQLATAVPDTLTLRGISGTANRRFALINDRTLTKNETAKVRVGNTNVIVRCLDISQHSVILDVNGSSPDISQVEELGGILVGDCDGNGRSDLIWVSWEVLKGH